MVQAVLVAYASKHGSTKEVAEAISATLRALGSKVDVVAAGGVKDWLGMTPSLLAAPCTTTAGRRRPAACSSACGPNCVSGRPGCSAAAPPVGRQTRTRRWLRQRVMTVPSRRRVSSMRLGGSVPANTSPFPAR
jgi:hypothetical protein